MGKLFAIVISWLGLFFSMWAAFAGEHSGISPWVGLVLLVLSVLIGWVAIRSINKATRA